VRRSGQRVSSHDGRVCQRMANRYNGCGTKNRAGQSVVRELVRSAAFWELVRLRGRLRGDIVWESEDCALSLIEGPVTGTLYPRRVGIERAPVSLHREATRMSELAQRKLLLACTLPVLVALFLSATIAPTLRDPPEPQIDAGKALVKRLRRDRQIAQIVPASVRGQGSLIALANEHPLLLDGLVKAVTAPDEYYRVRSQAFSVLMQIDSDEALVEQIKVIQTRFRENPPKGRRDAMLRIQVGNWTLRTVLGAQIPDEECLAIVKCARPRVWEEILTNYADMSEPPSVMGSTPSAFRERVARIPSRAEQLLEMVR